MWHDAPDLLTQSAVVQNTLKERYVVEMKRKERLNMVVSRYYILLVPLMAVLVGICHEMFQDGWSHLGLGFRICFGLCVVAFAISLYHHTRASFVVYRHASLPSEILQHGKALLDFCESEGTTPSQEELDQALRADLAGQFGAFAESNAKSNDLKEIHITLFKRSLLITILLAVLVSVMLYSAEKVAS
jgi:hypothetical protein